VKPDYARLVPDAGTSRPRMPWSARGHVFPRTSGCERVRRQTNRR